MLKGEKQDKCWKIKIFLLPKTLQVDTILTSSNGRSKDQEEGRINLMCQVVEVVEAQAIKAAELERVK